MAPPFWTVDPAWRGADAHGLAHEAVARFEECRWFSPDFGRSYIASAIIYSGAGQSEKAREPLEELLVRHPDDEGIHSALEKIGSKMRMLRVIASCLVALPVLAAFCAASDEVGIISGTVRDVQSKPVEGAKDLRQAREDLDAQRAAVHAAVDELERAVREELAS